MSETLSDLTENRTTDLKQITGKLTERTITLSLIYLGNVRKKIPTTKPIQTKTDTLDSIGGAGSQTGVQL